MDSTWSMMPQPMNDQYFRIRWNNYQRNMTAIFHELLESQSFVDVTLACEYESLKAHKVVLSACSAYFRKLLLDNPCDHPTIIMPHDIGFADLSYIIKFVYQGEINVTENQLQSLWAKELSPSLSLILTHTILELLSAVVFLAVEPAS
ncbi:broad-complex core protein isoforms 1/2/3/4/5-like [Sergentomyia squamirostris]